MPQWDASDVRDVLRQVRERALKVFAELSTADVLVAMDRVDAAFADPTRPGMASLVDLIHRVEGFSRHDIEHYGLGIFRRLLDSAGPRSGVFIRRALATRRPVETASGHLLRLGFSSPFTRQRPAGLVSHITSGNVAGYSALLCRIGLPIIGPGAAQVVKLPSEGALFPMLYLSKMGEVAPLVRQTIAAGWWRGGDASVEGPVLAASEAVNVLGSDSAVRDIRSRAGAERRRPKILAHGHKVGAAYVARAFVESPELRERTIEGLVGDISAFDGAGCFSVKNLYVQGDYRAFASALSEALGRFASTESPVNPALAPVGRSLGRTFAGCPNVLKAGDDSGFVRMEESPVFWIPEETYRYVRIMPVSGPTEVSDILVRARRFLQTLIIAVPDEDILKALELFGRAGVSNIHYPGSAPLLNVYEEPHDGDFDFVKIHFPYTVRFAAVNFKRNADWLS